VVLREANRVDGDCDIFALLETLKEFVQLGKSLLTPASLSISEEHDNEFGALLSMLLFFSIFVLDGLL
jgi:hypothetical protein